jgi:hypothetical protein
MEQTNRPEIRPVSAKPLDHLVDPMPAELDIDQYRHHLQTLALTPEQETELLRTLCAIMISFAELGWGHVPAPSILSAIARKAWDRDEKALDQNSDLIQTFQQVTENP